MPFDSLFGAHSLARHVSGLSQLVSSLDPHAVTAVNDFRILVNVYDGLTRYRDGTLELIV